DRVRYRHGDADALNRKIPAVSGLIPDARPIRDSSSVRDSFRSESEHRRMGVSAGDRSASGDMGQSIVHEGRTGSGVSEGLESGGIWDEVKYRIIGYPLAIFKMIRFLAIVFYHFTKAVWYGEVFPLRPQKKIIDHGEVIGYLD